MGDCLRQVNHFCIWPNQGLIQPFILPWCVNRVSARLVKVNPGRVHSVASRRGISHNKPKLLNACAGDNVCGRLSLVNRTYVSVPRPSTCCSLPPPRSTRWNPPARGFPVVGVDLTAVTVCPTRRAAAALRTSTPTCGRPCRRMTLSSGLEDCRNIQPTRWSTTSNTIRRRRRRNHAASSPDRRRWRPLASTKQPPRRHQTVLGWCRAEQLCSSRTLTIVTSSRDSSWRSDCDDGPMDYVSDNNTLKLHFHYGCALRCVWRV